MNVFKVPDSLADKYHGTGQAVAATVGGQLVDFVYIEDALPDFEGPATAAIGDARILPVVRQLQALGEVHFGMLSCWEFCEQ